MTRAGHTFCYDTKVFLFVWVFFFFWGGGCCLRHRKIKCRCGLHHKKKECCYLHHRKKRKKCCRCRLDGGKKKGSGSGGPPCRRVYKECWSLSTGTGPGGGKKGRKIRPKTLPTRECRMNPATLSWVPTRCHTPSGQSLNSLPHPIWSVSKLTATPHLVSL